MVDFTIMPAEINCPLYEARKMHEIYEDAICDKQQGRWRILIGIEVGVKAAFWTFAWRIAYLAEVLFKGFANIFGAPFSDECECHIGAKILTEELTKALINLAILPFELVFCPPATVAFVLIDEWHFHSRLEEWDKTSFKCEKNVIN